jgi:aminoglycoside phosphotransferase (APT) family kinase protein
MLELELESTLATSSLAEWLRGKLGADTLIVESQGRPPLNGASNETLMLRARWSTRGLERTGGFVARGAPKGFALYHHYELEVQYRTMEQLRRTHVPVPPLVGYEADSNVLGEPFYVMEEVEGIGPPDIPPFTTVGWLLESPAEEQAELYDASIEMLARIHSLDIGTIDLSFLNRSAGKSGFDDQLARAEQWFRWAAEDRPQPTMERVLDWLLVHRPSSPPPEGLNWGDARVGNMLYRSLHPVVVLDWEMAGLGPGEVDLGWWLFVNRHHSEGLGVPQLPGFPDDATTVSRYEDALGRRVKDMLYYDVFGGFRFGIILIRASQKMHAEGVMPADSDYEVNNGATRLLAQMLDLPTPG